MLHLQLNKTVLAAGLHFPNIPFFNIKAQTATQYEVGTRGRRPEYTWDVAVYRADIRNELQCFFSSFGNCNVTNADRTIHQGIETGAGVSLFNEMRVQADIKRLISLLTRNYERKS